jgi:cysteine desulfurase / selenocysteine lyase
MTVTSVRGAAPATPGPAPSRAPFDARRIRAEFPILNDGRTPPLVYLDSAATSQKPDAVLRAMDDYYATTNANIHRGIYAIAEQATAAYEDARRRVARFVNAGSPRELIFTRNSTEAINLVAYAWGRAFVNAGDAIVLTEMEHHSNLVPWQMLARERGAELRYVPVTPGGELQLDALPGLLADGRVRLVGAVHVSNVLGTVNPVAEIARLAHAAGALVLVDGSQSVPHLAVDVRALDCDFLAFTSHKMLGPTGIGALWARREILEAMPPFLGGGEMIREVGWHESTWNELPWKFEAGTMAIAEAIGFGAAVDYLEAIGTTCSRTIASWRPTRSSACARCRTCACWGRRPGVAAAWWHSSSAACTRTTSPPCSTGAAWRCAPDTTAPCRCTGSSACRPRRAPRSTCTRCRRTWTR